MTTPEHIKIVARGRFLGTPEEWSFSTKWAQTSSAAWFEQYLGIPQTVSLLGFAGAPATWVNEGELKTALSNHIAGTGYSTRVQCTEARVYAIGPDGKMQGEPKIFDWLSSPISGVSTTAKKPVQTTWCVTTEGAKRGHARFGRFYLPPPQIELEDDWRTPLAYTQAMVTNVQTMLKAIAGSIHIPGTTGNARMINVSSLGQGRVQVVDHIKIGRTLDTMRSRRGHLDEDYQLGPHIDW